MRNIFTDTPAVEHGERFEEWLRCRNVVTERIVSSDKPETVLGTMKYTPAFPSKPFERLAGARAWVHSFVQWYNEQHRHSAIQFVTPAERHCGAHQAILAKRKELYEV